MRKNAQKTTKSTKNTPKTAKRTSSTNKSNKAVKVATKSNDKVVFSKKTIKTTKKHPIKEKSKQSHFTTICRRYK